MSGIVRGARAVLVLLVLATVAGCDDGPTEDPTVTPPVVNTTTERFEETIGVNSARTHPFAAGSGVMTATLTSVTPDETTVVGLSLGLWDGASCQLVVTNDAAKQGVAVVGQASTFGNYCVRVYDIGRITVPTSYVVEVVHRP